jgi:hypothetical protein
VLERAERTGKRSHGAVFVGTRQGDIEGQDLVGIPGSGQLIQSTDFLQGKVVDLVDDRTHAGTDGTGQRGSEHGRGVDFRVLVLGTDLVHISDELAQCLMEEGQEGMTIEVDPDQGAGDGCLLLAGDGQLFWWPAEKMLWLLRILDMSTVIIISMITRTRGISF